MTLHADPHGSLDARETMSQPLAAETARQARPGAVLARQR